MMGPFHLSHARTVRQASTSEKAVEGVSSSEMGQLFSPFVVLSHRLHYFDNGLRTRRAPSHLDGRVTPHYTTSLTATAETVMLTRSLIHHPSVAGTAETVMLARSLLRHPSVAGTEHRDTLSTTVRAPLSGTFLQRLKEGCRKPVLGVCLSACGPQACSVFTGVFSRVYWL